MQNWDKKLSVEIFEEARKIEKIKIDGQATMDLVKTLLEQNEKILRLERRIETLTEDLHKGLSSMESKESAWEWAKSNSKFARRCCIKSAKKFDDDYLNFYRKFCELSRRVEKLENRSPFEWLKFWKW